MGLNKKLFYPKMGTDKRVGLVQVHGADDFQPGAFGALEPTGDSVLADADRVRLVVFVPGLAFDLTGNRLGRGWGWYDRVLSLLPEGTPFVGLAYEFQVLESLPAERWDERMSHIITDKRIIQCGLRTSPSGQAPQI